MDTRAEHTVSPFSVAWEVMVGDVYTSFILELLDGLLILVTQRENLFLLNLFIIVTITPRLGSREFRQDRSSLYFDLRKIGVGKCAFFQNYFLCI